MNRTLQTLCYRGCLPSQHEAFCGCSQSGGESCPVRAKTRRSDCRSPVCSHPKRGKNLPHRYISFETPSILHRLLSDHRRLQILPNHQDRFCIHHWSCRLTCKLRRSSYKQLKEQREKVKPNEHQVNWIVFVQSKSHFPTNLSHLASHKFGSSWCFGFLVQVWSVAVECQKTYFLFSWSSDQRRNSCYWYYNVDDVSYRYRFLLV